MVEKMIVVGVSALMIIFELIPLFKEGKKKIAAIYTVLLSVAFAAFFVTESGFDIPIIHDILNAIAGKI